MILIPLVLYLVNIVHITFTASSTQALPGAYTTKLHKHLEKSPSLIVFQPSESEMLGKLGIATNGGPLSYKILEIDL
jgi:hypothetical protein